MDTKTKSVKPLHTSTTSTTPRSNSATPFFQKSSEEDASSSFFQMGVQTKLTLGRRGDPYEQEADSVADRVVSGDGAANGTPVITPINGSLQRVAEEEAQTQLEGEEEEEPIQAQEEEEAQTQPEGEEEEEPIQAQEEEEAQTQPEGEEEEEPIQAQEEEEAQTQPEGEEEEEPIQAQAQSTAEPDVLPAGGIESQLRRSRGMGSPLLESVRTKMEGQLGADFSGIRIHTDDISVQMTRLLKAQAFTHGKDIYFNRSKFAPHSRGGRHLLAHELTHTVQQGAAQTRAPQPEGDPARVQRKEDEGSTYMIRPELLKAIKQARSQIGKINAQKTNAEGTRIGWERLYDIFLTAFGGKEVIAQQVIKYRKPYKGKDPLPSWCGIFVWWSLKSAGVPIPDWKLGKSIAGDVVARKHGELPRKGDIAYMGPAHNDHFAIVSGVESQESAEGKDYKSIRVATVNGNTAGENHLGGQVQEKWHTIGQWVAFFDPIAKLDMPPVTLVETGIEPDQVTADDEATEAAAKTPKPDVDTPPTDVAHLEEDVVTEPSLPAEGDSEVSVDLPEPPSTPPAEKAAAVKELALEGSSDEAMVGFTEASPSQMAKTQPNLGEKLDGKINKEKKDEVENAPVLTAQTSGKVDEGLTPPDQIPVPSDAQLGDGVKGPEPSNLQPGAHEYKDATPNNKDNDKLIDDKEEGGFLDWFRNNIRSFMNRIRTKDPTMDTSAGKRPNVKLEGQADPGRMETQRTDATSQLKGQRDAVTEKLKNHPGQQNIQPKEIREDRKAKLSPEVPVKIETETDSGAKDYVDAPLSAGVRNKSDELLQPDLESHLSESKTKTKDVAGKRDKDKASEIKKAEDQVAQQNQQADKEQRDIVVANRKKVADQQKTGIQDAYTKVNDFNTEADTKQQAARKEIGDKVKTSEDGAREELRKGEVKADGIKKEGEEKAAAEKKKLEKEQEKESWWDKAANLVKKAVKKITEAIDSAFTWMREQVAKAIEAAKDLAVGLINAARDWIKDKLNAFRDWAKGMVDKYLKEHFPGLAAAINSKIDSVVDTAIAGVDMVADAAIKTVEALADALSKVLDGILAAFQTGLKAAVAIAGAVLTGDFAEALRIAIQAGCDLAGIDSKPIFDFIDRAKSAVMDIIKEPGKFFNNLVSAVGGGIRNFVKNIKKHLLKGLIGWLTGAISEAGITLPDKFDVKGIFSLVMQILGLTYENIKARLIKKFPPAAKVIGLIEKGFVIVKRLVTEGPMALWEMVKEKLANLKEMVIGGVRDWVIMTVVKEGVIWLLSLLNPAGALVKVLKLLFDFVMFLVERFQQIKDFVMSVYNSITAIASGALGKAMAAVEDALSRSVPVVISLLASLIGLGGIGKTVKKIIGKVTKPINKMIDKIIMKVVKFAKKLLKKGKSAAGKVKEKLFEWWKVKTTLKAKDGSSHSMYLKGSAASAKLMIRSEEKLYSAFLDSVSTEKGTAAYKSARAAAAAFETEKNKKLPKDAPTAEQKKKKERLEKHLAALKTHTSKLFSDDMPAWEKPTYGGLSPFGTSMKANVLTLKDKPAGTPPKDAGAAWDELNERRQPGGASYYIRGHLLNDNVGGPGTWPNMTPLSRSGNSKHEKEVESTVKSEVAAGHIVQYHVTPRYEARAGGPGIVSKAGAGLAADDRKRIAGIVARENAVPTKLQIAAKRLEAKPGGGYKTVKTLFSGSVDNPVSRDPESYHLSGAHKIPAVNINSLQNGAPLKAFGSEKLTGIADSIAAAAKKNKDESNPDFKTYAEVAAAAGSPGLGADLQGWAKKDWIRLKS